MLVVLPAGLWVFSLGCDLLYLGGAEAEIWSRLALYTMVGGSIGAFHRAGAAGFRRPDERHPHRRRSLRSEHLAAPRRSEFAKHALSVIGVGMLAFSSWLEVQLLRVHGKRWIRSPADHRAPCPESRRSMKSRSSTTTRGPSSRPARALALLSAFSRSAMSADCCAQAAGERSGAVHCLCGVARHRRRRSSDLDRPGHRDPRRRAAGRRGHRASRRLGNDRQRSPSNPALTWCRRIQRDRGAR